MVFSPIQALKPTFRQVEVVIVATTMQDLEHLLLVLPLLVPLQAHRQGEIIVSAAVAGRTALTRRQCL